MSLNDVRLSPLMVQQLYQDTLVGKATLPFLGGNRHHIVLMVNNPADVYLADAQMVFLTGILKACNLDLDDIALINFHANPRVTNKEINHELYAKVMLLFGVAPADIDLPFTIPHFQIQEYNDQKYLSAPALDVLQNDVDQKKKLWTSLQQIFIPGS